MPNSNFSKFFLVLAFVTSMAPAALRAQALPVSQTVTCDGLFESTISMIQHVKNPSYGGDPGDVKRMVEMIAKSQNNEVELNRALIVSYMTIRLHNETPDVQQLAIAIVTRNLGERDSLFDFNETQSSHYAYGTKRFLFAIPKAHEDHLLTGYIFAHEFEHLLQDLTVGVYRMNVLASAHEVAETEEAAMRAEFVFLQTIPRAVREKLLRDYISPKNTPGGTLDLFLGAVGVSLKTSDPALYVRTMWAINRYRPKPAGSL